MPVRIKAFREAQDQLVALLDQVESDSAKWWTVLWYGEAIQLGLNALLAGDRKERV